MNYKNGFLVKEEGDKITNIHAMYYEKDNSSLFGLFDNYILRNTGSLDGSSDYGYSSFKKLSKGGRKFIIGLLASAILGGSGIMAYSSMDNNSSCHIKSVQNKELKIKKSSNIKDDSFEKRVEYIKNKLKSKSNSKLNNNLENRINDIGSIKKIEVPKVKKLDNSLKYKGTHKVKRENKNIGNNYVNSGISNYKIKCVKKETGFSMPPKFYNECSYAPNKIIRFTEPVGPNKTIFGYDPKTKELNSDFDSKSLPPKLRFYLDMNFK